LGGVVTRSMHLIGVLLMTSCASTFTSTPRSHEITCRDLSGVSFRYTRAADESAPISPWRSVQLVWLGNATGITGRDLDALRVIEAPKHTFGPGEIGPSDPRFDPTRQPLVPTLEFLFSPEGDARFREMLKSLWKDDEEERHIGKSLALLLEDHLFLMLSIPPRDVWPPDHSWRVEPTRTSYEDLVSHIESALGCS
jgi:hypothetical protein